MLSRYWPWHLSPRSSHLPCSQCNLFLRSGVGCLTGLLFAGGSQSSSRGPQASFCDSVGPSSFLHLSFLFSHSELSSFTIWLHGVFQQSLPIKSCYSWLLDFARINIFTEEIWGPGKRTYHRRWIGVLFSREKSGYFTSWGRQLTFWYTVVYRTSKFCNWSLTLLVSNSLEHVYTHTHTPCTRIHMLLSVNTGR